MKITQAFDVARPAADVWAFFSDVPAVARCLPGAELTADKGDGTYAGKVSIKLGPFGAAFEGEATVKHNDDGPDRPRRRQGRRQARRQPLEDGDGLCGDRRRRLGTRHHRCRGDAGRPDRPVRPHRPHQRDGKTADRPVRRQPRTGACGAGTGGGAGCRRRFRSARRHRQIGRPRPPALRRPHRSPSTPSAYCGAP